MLSSKFPPNDAGPFPAARVLYDEVDYKNEAKNASEFAQQFQGTEWIKVPKIFW